MNRILKIHLTGHDREIFLLPSYFVVTANLHCENNEEIRNDSFLFEDLTIQLLEVYHNL
jgi:hypothetical protein